MTVAEATTRHVDVAGRTGKAVELLPPGFRVPRVQGVGKRHYSWIICLEDDAIYVEVQWREDGARCKALTVLRANVNFKAISERGADESP